MVRKILTNMHDIIQMHLKAIFHCKIIWLSVAPLFCFILSPSSFNSESDHERGLTLWLRKWRKEIYDRSAKKIKTTFDDEQKEL